MKIIVKKGSKLLPISYEKLCFDESGKLIRNFIHNDCDKFEYIINDEFEILCDSNASLKIISVKKIKNLYYIVCEYNSL